MCMNTCVSVCFSVCLLQINYIHGNDREAVEVRRAPT